MSAFPAFARRYFQERDPLQRSMRVWLGGDDSVAVRIVGVAHDAKYDSLRETPEPLLYLPISQVPVQRGVVLMARTAGEPLQLAGAVSRAIEAAAPGIIVRWHYAPARSASASR